MEVASEHEALGLRIGGRCLGLFATVVFPVRYVHIPVEMGAVTLVRRRAGLVVLVITRYQM